MYHSSLALHTIGEKIVKKWNPSYYGEEENFSELNQEILIGAENKKNDLWQNDGKEKPTILLSIKPSREISHYSPMVMMKNNSIFLCDCDELTMGLETILCQGGCADWNPP